MSSPLSNRNAVEHDLFITQPTKKDEGTKAEVIAKIGARNVTINLKYDSTVTGNRVQTDVNKIIILVNKMGVGGTFELSSSGKLLNKDRILSNYNQHLAVEMQRVQNKINRGSATPGELKRLEKKGEIVSKVLNNFEKMVGGTKNKSEEYQGLEDIGKLYKHDTKFNGETKVALTKQSDTNAGKSQDVQKQVKTTFAEQPEGGPKNKHISKRPEGEGVRAQIGPEGLKKVDGGLRTAKPFNENTVKFEELTKTGSKELNNVQYAGTNALMDIFKQNKAPIGFKNSNLKFVVEELKAFLGAANIKPNASNIDQLKKDFAHFLSNRMSQAGTIDLETFKDVGFNHLGQPPSQDVFQSPEYKSLKEAAQNGTWKAGEERPITFTNIDAKDQKAVLDSSLKLFDDKGFKDYLKLLAEPKTQENVKFSEVDTIKTKAGTPNKEDLITRPMRDAENKANTSSISDLIGQSPLKEKVNPQAHETEQALMSLQDEATRVLQKDGKKVDAHALTEKMKELNTRNEVYTNTELMEILGAMHAEIGNVADLKIALKGQFGSDVNIIPDKKNNQFTIIYNRCDPKEIDSHGKKLQRQEQLSRIGQRKPITGMQKDAKIGTGPKVEEQKPLPPFALKQQVKKGDISELINKKDKISISNNLKTQLKQPGTSPEQTMLRKGQTANTRGFGGNVLLRKFDKDDKKVFDNGVKEALVYVAERGKMSSDQKKTFVHVSGHLLNISDMRERLTDPQLGLKSFYNDKLKTNGSRPASKSSENWDYRIVDDYKSSELSSVQKNELMNMKRELEKIRADIKVLDPKLGKDIISQNAMGTLEANVTRLLKEINFMLGAIPREQYRM